MERYNLAELTKKLYNVGILIFDIQTIRSILEIKNEPTFFSVLKQLINSGILDKLERGKYILRDTSANEFLLANFLYSPSYISLESALNFYGILPQFPYEISSVTLKKTLAKKTKGRIFSYIHIKKELFWGYQKQNDYLIALPEKSLLDQLYLWSKGLRSINVDECEFSSLNKGRLKEFLKKYPQNRQTRKMKELLKGYSLI